ncbi:transposase [Peribacillus frigoritolerans]
MKKQTISSSSRCKTYIAIRKETIERVFGTAKEKHGMRWITLRGIS